MLTREQDERLTRIGPGMPMGHVFRRYWLPAIATDELAEPDGAPVRLKLLGEDLIAFRDTDGRTGVVSEFCAHRRASLFFGRNEECGLRCAYHGWKFDVNGVCTDLPSEPDYQSWTRKISITAYPTVERGGVVWVYMGPPELRPAPPEFEWAVLPEPNRRVMRRLIECNWLQGVEGALDPVHVAILHRFEIAHDPIFGNTRSSDYMDEHRAVLFDCVEADDGLAVTARRDGGNGTYYWRFSRFVLPCFTMAPPFGRDALINWSAFVPRDDESCLRWTVACHPTRAMTDRERAALASGGANHVDVDPVTLRARANKDNDYLIDRAGQKARKTYSGVYGIALQDQAVQESQGAIYDRTQEVLVAGDKFIVNARKLLLDATDVVSAGALPGGRDARAQRVRSASTVAPQSQPLADVIASGILQTRLGSPLISV